MSFPILAASIFSPFPQIVFGFSTRKGGVSSEPYGCNMSYSVGDDAANVKENQKRFLEHLGVRTENLAVPKQVHGDNVVRVSRPGIYENCDALISNKKGVFLRITTADCLPLFLFDPNSGSVAAVHAGWRGCVQQIAQKTIIQMGEEFSTKPGELRVYIGPSARKCCYEVGEDVTRKFNQRFLIDTGGERPHFDMLGFTLDLLRESGVDNLHIEVSPHCTICTPQLFHSYRRDGAKSGRMMGVIGLR